MDEERKNYIVRAIYDLADVSKHDKYDVAYLLNGNITQYHIPPILSDEEYEEIISDFEKNDEVFESIINQTADLDQLHKESVDKVEAFLFGGSSETSMDGIIQWINSPDCPTRELVRLREAINKTL
jgi:hypothetical protein